VGDILYDKTMKLWKANFKDREEFEIKYDCIPKGLALEFQSDTIEKDSFLEYVEKFKNYVIITSIIMMILIYNSVNEADNFWTLFTLRA